MWRQLRSVRAQLAIAVTFVALTGCPSANQPPDTFVLESIAFIDGAEIPELFAGPGSLVSPPLFWSRPPEGTQQLALIVTDEANRARWILYGIEPEFTNLPEGIPEGPLASFPPGARQGMTFNGLTAYQGGILSEEGSMLLQFTLYALDTKLNPENSLFLNEILEAMQGHIIGQAKLIGTFSSGNG